MMKGDRQWAIGDRKKIICYLLVLSAYCLLLTGISESAEKENLMSDINRMILKELKSSISENVEIAELRVVRGADSLDELTGYAVNKIVMDGYAGRNRINFRVGLRDRRMGTRNIIVETSYNVLVDVFIASRPLVKGAVLTPEDFYSVKQKSSKLPAGAISNKDEIEGKILKTNIGQGVILRSDYLTSHLGIKRGQRVNVMVEGNNVVITTQGILRNDTLIGGVAKVLCDATKKEVSGVLTSPNTVRVKI